MDRTSRTVLIIGTALLGGGLVDGIALAQAPAAPGGSAPPGQPEVKTIGDWAVRCYPMQSAKWKRLCV